MNFTIKEKSSIYPHFIFWSVVWLFYIFVFSYNSADINYVLFFSTLLIPITAIPTYFMVAFLIPKYLASKKYVLFGIYTLSTLLFTILCILLLLMLSVGYVNNFSFEDLPPMGKNYIYLTLLVFLIVSLVSFVSIWRKNTQTSMKNVELQKQLLTAQLKMKEQELAYLKNQIHPHFLFNTLNTIYGFALKKSKDTPDVILKFSNLLDYILYQTNKTEVPLVDELNHLEQYIDLEKIRFPETLKICVNKKIGNEKFQIAPMLLLPFVENAFKHGSIIDDCLRINIDIETRENELFFSIKNTFQKQNVKEGLGLKNIKERLELLYPGNYDLQVETKSEWFEITLQLNQVKQKS